MLRAIALAIAIGVIGGGTAMTQTIQRPLPAGLGGVVLVKHDKEDNGRGRKLGHYKNRGSDDDLDDDGDSITTTRHTDRFGTTTTTTQRSWINPPGYYDDAPP